MASTKREPVTQELWDRHLSGQDRLGIVPVLKDGTCWWFVIDVDRYLEPHLLKHITDAITAHGLPLVVTMSKSGGAHLWCFLATPVAWAKIKKLAENFISKIALPPDPKDGKPHIDLFPKQDKAKDVGSWVNMPYFGEQAHCVGADGTQNYTIEQFETFANEHIVDLADLSVKAKEEKRSERPPYPPCIEHMMSEGIPEGHRNDCLTQFGIYAMRAFPDDWKEKLQEFNEEYCEEPLDKAEMRNIYKSLQAHQYQYLCRAMKEIYCDKTECKKREFGVGNAQDSTIGIEHMEKIDGEEPIYRITMDGVKYQVTLDQLYLYTAFKKATLGAINRFLPSMKQEDWEQQMHDTLEGMEISEAAADTQMRDRVIRTFQRYAENATAESLNVAVNRGVPYYDGKNIIFRGDDFMQVIDRQLKLTRDKTWIYMRDWGTVQVDFTIDGKRTQFWCYVITGPLWFNVDDKEQA